MTCYQVYPEKAGNYGYAYSQILDDDEDGFEGLFISIDKSIYIEEDLFFVRKASKEELNIMLGEALGYIERYEDIVKAIREEMRKTD